MKTNLIFFALLTLYLVSSQNVVSQVGGSSTTHTASDTLNLAFRYVDSHEQKIQGMQYCFKNFYSSYMSGVIISGIGMGITVLSTAYDEPEMLGAGVLLGGAVSLVGLIVSIDSFKWLKRAGVAPADYGVGFKVRLHK
jgi:hypothetical protein